METPIIAYCGLNCSECDAYKATQSKDEAELERVAAAWREFGYNVTAASILCDGCLVTEGHLGGYCSECPIRACAIDRGIASCAHCPDYGCKTIEEFLSHDPKFRQTLEAIRATFLGTTGD